MRDALGLLIRIIIQGDEAYIEEIKRVQEDIEEQCAALRLFLSSLSSLGWDGTLNSPRSVAPPSSRTFKQNLKAASLSLSNNRLHKTENSKTVMNAINDTIALYSKRALLRIEIVLEIRNLVNGSTNYHLDIFSRRLNNIEQFDVKNQLESFRTNHIVDAVQPPVDDVLYLALRLRTSPRLTKIHKVIQNIDLSEQEKAMLIKLELLTHSVCISEGVFHEATAAVINRKKRVRKTSNPRSRSPREHCSEREKVGLVISLDSPTTRKRSLFSLVPSNEIDSERQGPLSPGRKREQNQRSKSVKNTKSFFQFPSSSVSTGKQKKEIREINETLGSVRKTLLASSPRGKGDSVQNLFLKPFPHGFLKEQVATGAKTDRRTIGPPPMAELAKKRKSVYRLVVPCIGYWLEEGYDFDKPISYHGEEVCDDIEACRWFPKYFADVNSYEIYISNSTLEGVAIIITKKEKENGKQSNTRALYFTKTKTTGFLFPSTQIRDKLNIRTSGKTGLKKIISSVDPLLTPKSFRKCVESNLAHETLCELQKLEISELNQKTTFKFGLLNWQEGNKNEEDMFSNTTVSPDFRDFMNLLGNVINLHEWDQYSGGLDTNGNLSGTNSLFSTFDGNSIMFHVAPFLPFSPKNRQQLDRKRHIGNDVVVLIFREASKPYLTSLIASQFNHVFIVVSLIEVEGKTRYSVAVTAKEEVPMFAPQLPPNGIFTSKSELKKFLLTKMINGEKASSLAPAFVKRATKSRELLLRLHSERCHC